VARIALVVCALASVLSACTTPSSVRIQLVTDLAPEREFDEVRVTVTPDAETRSVRASAERSWGRGVRVASLDGLPAGTHDVRVALHLGGALVQEQSRRFVSGTGSSTVTVLITRDCAGITCTPDEACAAAQCVSRECTLENPMACPSAARCTASACGAAMGCIVPECRPEGLCFSAPDDALCAQSEYCDALLGCVPRGAPLDAGPPDVDASVDDAGAHDAAEVAPTVAPALGFPWNGAITSVTPTIQIVPAAGATMTHIQIDDSCDPHDFDACTFSAPQVDVTFSGATYTSSVLPVSTVAPVGRRYFVRVAACNGGGCGPWGRPRYFDAGRARGDVNGDGFSDAVIGAPGGTGEGGAYVLFGGAGGGSGLSTPGPLPSSAFTPDANDLFGSAAAFVGDVNADGCADFVIGAPGGNSPTVADVGMAHLYLGSALAGPGLAFFSHSQLTESVVDSRFGGTVAGVGDLDRDGRADIAIGAIGEAGGGAVYVLFGRDTATGATTRIPAPSPTDFAFGTAIAGIGDGTSDYASFHVSTNGSPALVYTFGVPTTTLSTAPIGTVVSPRSSELDGFGHSIVASCDIDADGLTDGIFGSPDWSDSGTVIVAFAHGTIVALDSPFGAGDEFGSAVACADMTGDGIADVVASSPVFDAVIIFGGGDRTLIPLVTGTIFPATRVGFAAAAGFDFDGDGASDALFGAPAGGGLGQVVVLRGPWRTGTNGTAIDSGSGANDQFGYAIAAPPP
jgi:hypothetical protein